MDSWALDPWAHGLCPMGPLYGPMGPLYEGYAGPITPLCGPIIPLKGFYFAITGRSTACVRSRGGPANELDAFPVCAIHCHHIGLHFTAVIFIYKV